MHPPVPTDVGYAGLAADTAARSLPISWGLGPDIYEVAAPASANLGALLDEVRTLRRLLGKAPATVLPHS